MLGMLCIPSSFLAFPHRRESIFYSSCVYIQRPPGVSAYLHIERPPDGHFERSREIYLKIIAVGDTTILLFFI